MIGNECDYVAPGYSWIDRPRLVACLVETPSRDSANTMFHKATARVRLLVDAIWVERVDSRIILLQPRSVGPPGRSSGRVMRWITSGGGWRRRDMRGAVGRWRGHRCQDRSVRYSVTVVRRASLHWLSRIKRALRSRGLLIVQRWNDRTPRAFLILSANLSGLPRLSLITHMPHIERILGR